MPAVNIKEDNDGFNVEMAAPGMKKDDFKVDLDNNLLTISAEKESEDNEKDDEGNYTRREFNYQSFKRTFTLPDAAQADKIKATYKEGVLTINIPKKEKQSQSLRKVFQ